MIWNNLNRNMYINLQLSRMQMFVDIEIVPTLQVLKCLKKTIFYICKNVPLEKIEFIFARFMCKSSYMIDSFDLSGFINEMY